VTTAAHLPAQPFSNRAASASYLQAMPAFSDTDFFIFSKIRSVPGSSNVSTSERRPRQWVLVFRHEMLRGTRMHCGSRAAFTPP
jgi:hypothetical protein